MDDDALLLNFTALADVDPEADAGLEPPEGHRGPVPVGLSLLARVASGLEERGWEIPHCWVIPHGHGLEARAGGRRLDVTLTCQDLESGRWTLGAEVRRGLFPWARKPGGEPQARLEGDLRALLEADPQVGALS